MITETEEAIIQEWMDKDLSRLAFELSSSEISVSFISDQVKGRRKIKEKFPFLESVEGFVFPPYLSVEQSSSQFTAFAKSQLIQGSKILDMTGGMGIDAHFLAKTNSHYTLIEKDANLVDVNRHNFNLQNVSNVDIICDDSKSYLEKTDDTYDVIYIDPARRSVDGSNKKVFLLEDLRPNVLAIQESLWAKAQDIWIKLSPLIDISYLISAFGKIREIIVLSVKNEVKEVLVHLSESMEEGVKSERIAMDINRNSMLSMISDDLRAPTRIDNFQGFGQYLYEPSKAIIKAQLADCAAEKCGLNKLQSNTFFYSLNSQVGNWQGRIFKMDRILSARPKQFRKDFPYKKANIISRNHPMNAKTIAKKYALTEGGDRYILAFSDVNGRHLISAKRIQ